MGGCSVVQRHQTVYIDHLVMRDGGGSVRMEVGLMTTSGVEAVVEYRGAEAGAEIVGDIEVGQNMLKPVTSFGVVGARVER